MRKESNFVGTEEELTALMKNSLKNFTKDQVWLDEIQSSVSAQEYINICESLAECVDRGYFNDIGYIVLMNKTIIFHPNKMTCTIASESISEEELKKLRENIGYEPYSLTQSGKDFLNS